MPAFDKVVLSPRALMTTTGFSRGLLVNSSWEMEALLGQLILAEDAAKIDTAIFVGTGASGEPSGIYVAAGIQSYDVGPGAGANAAPDYTDLVTMAGLAGDANADGSVAFATTPLVAATLKKTLTFPAASAGGPIWEGDWDSGRAAGFPAIASNVLSKTLNNGVPGGGSEHGLVCGNFSDVLIGEWGAMEILVDAYTFKKVSRIELTTYHLVDVAFRHGASFVKGINAIP
jgi:HK97 family phage major capsid protein